MAKSSIAAGINILNMVGRRVPWNMCRNLEWLVCAAQGRLPAQSTGAVRFATLPGDLLAKTRHEACVSTNGDERCHPGRLYTNDDILSLEVRHSIRFDPIPSDPI